MYSTDKRILRLIDLLIFQKKINSTKEFCTEIEILNQTVSKIKKGDNHFTVSHIKKICNIYNVNANWVFGFENAVFNTKNSVEIEGF